MSKVTVEDLYVNPQTGLVACKYLGARVENPSNPDDTSREGHAGAGLRVGEIRGFEPEQAVKFINAGLAEPLDAKDVKKAAAADAGSRAASAEASARSRSAAAKAAADVADAEAAKAAAEAKG